MFSVVAIGDAWAGETLLRSQQIAQMDSAKPGGSSGGSCMPIGLTAKGELVFPWDCREIIERERGPVSVDLSMPSSEPTPKDPVAGEPAARTAVKTAAPKTAAPETAAPKTAAPGTAAPETALTTAPKAASANDTASKEQAASQSAEPDHVATIPDTAVLPPQPSAAAELGDHRAQGKRVAARRRMDTRDPRSPVQPAAAPPIRARLPVHPPG
jgi:hypothetical protein